MAIVYNAPMKRRAKQILALASLAGLGILTLALYPAILPDTLTDISLKAQKELTDSSGKKIKDPVMDMDIRYAVDITNPEGQTRYIGDIDPKASDLLQDARWNIHISVKDGNISVEGDKLELHAIDRLSHVRYSAAVAISDPGMEKQPDGSYHPVYYIRIMHSASVQPSFWGKSSSTLAMQTLKLEPVTGCLTPVEPRVTLDEVIGKHTALYVRYPVKGLASRFGDTPKEQALNGILLNLGKIDNKMLAAKAAAVLPEAAKKMLASHTDAGKPWPECWGEAAPLAEQCARQIVPTLLYLQENSCFGVKKLADFINSPTFARFFGDSFADKVPDPLDEPMPPFPIEKVDNLEPETNQPSH